MNDDEDDLSISFASSLDINEFLIDNKKESIVQLEKQSSLDKFSSQSPQRDTMTNMESIKTSIHGKEPLPKQQIQYPEEDYRKRSMLMKSIEDIWSKGVSEVKHDKVEGRKNDGKVTRQPQK